MGVSGGRVKRRRSTIFLEPSKPISVRTMRRYSWPMSMPVVDDFPGEIENFAGDLTVPDFLAGGSAGADPNSSLLRMTLRSFSVDVMSPS